MENLIFHRQTAILIFLIVPIFSFGQRTDSTKTETIEIGKKYKFYSEVLDEEREIWVRLPEGYESGTDKYPVVYVLDGNIDFIYMSGLL